MTDQSNSDIELIKKRRSELDKEKSKLQAKIDEIKKQEAELNQEAVDLAVTERTLARLHNKPLPEDPHPIAKSHSGKPKGLPTVAEMANIILREAEHKGIMALETQEIVEKVREKWWPEVTSNDVAPNLWRLARENRLVKDETRYSRPGRGNDTPAEEPPAKINGEVDPLP